MPVIHLDQWQSRRRPARVPAIDVTSLSCRISELEEALRQAGFEVAADLVAASDVAICQELARREPGGLAGVGAGVGKGR